MLGAPVAGQDDARPSEEYAARVRALGQSMIRLREAGRDAEAISPAREKLEIHRRILGEDPLRTASCYHQLAHLLAHQNRYAEAEAMLTEAARGYEIARRLIHHEGMERVVFAAEHSPLACLAAVLARQGQSELAWRPLETGLARGLYEDVSRPLEPEERRREQDLRAQLHRIDEQLVALASGPALTPRSLQGQQAESLRQRRETTQGELSAFEAEVDQKYGAAAGRPYELAQIQQQLPADAALVAWIDVFHAFRTDATAGEHWACLV
jgi:hypothetical protein